jgi:protein-disulfide isomerase
MPVHRRSVLEVVAFGAAAGALGSPRAASAADDPTRAERAIGSPEAKVVVGEYFSLTCTHCAAFARETMPQLKTQFIDTGKLRWVFHDFPLDQVALTAAMVARHLPPDRYEPFVNALFQMQDRWAFARGVNSNDELAKIAALAGMGRPAFDAAVADTGLRNWILQQQQADQDRWKIDSTPSFVVNGQKYAGEMSFEAFRKLLPAS